MKYITLINGLKIKGGNWSYNPYKWSYIEHYKTITLLIIASGPPYMGWFSTVR